MCVRKFSIQELEKVKRDVSVWFFIAHMDFVELTLKYILKKKKKQQFLMTK